MTIDEQLILNPGERVRDVIAEGGRFPPISPSVPLLRYYRSLNEMYRMGGVSAGEGDLETALKLYTRFSTICLEHLPQHPSFKTFVSTEKTKTKAKLNGALDNAMKIKKQLKATYEVEAELYRKEKEKELAEASAAAKARPPSPKPSPLSTPEIPYPDQHGEPPIVNTHDISFPGALLEDQKKIEPSAPVDNGAAGGPEPATMGFEDATTGARLKPDVPPRSSKPGAVVAGATVPQPDRSLKPASDVAGIGVSYLPQNIYGLRNVIIPETLLRQFMTLAEPNTALNVETCGILGGKLAQHRFVISHLIIPKQKGTSDSCLTEKEEEVFDYQDKHELITLGWIHTHPTQTAFLSSVDLHTHCSYQLMLPEAVAVVCSPKFNERGVFALTPQGLTEVADCRQTGFHPHQQHPPLFENGQHAVIAEGYNTEVADFRS